jgi:hypothetical protein
MDESFIRTKLALEELKDLGYTEVWLGNVPNPHWEHCMSNGIIAAPRHRICGDPAVWRASERNFGELGCGNGLLDADQCQRELVRKMMPGHYVLEDGRWIPGNSKDPGVVAS